MNILTEYAPGLWIQEKLDWNCIGLNLKHDAFSRFGEGGYSVVFASVPNSRVEFKPLAAAKEIYSQSSKAARFQLISD